MTSGSHFSAFAGIPAFCSPFQARSILLFKLAMLCSVVLPCSFSSRLILTAAAAMPTDMAKIGSRPLLCCQSSISPYYPAGRRAPTYLEMRNGVDMVASCSRLSVLLAGFLVRGRLARSSTTEARARDCAAGSTSEDLGLVITSSSHDGMLTVM